MAEPSPRPDRSIDQQVADALIDSAMTPETQAAVEAVLRETYRLLVEQTEGNDHG